MKFLLSIFLCTCAMTSLMAQNPEVELTLRLPQTAFFLDSSFPVAVTWRNPSQDRTIALRGDPGPSDSGGLEFVIVAPQGTTRTYTPFRGRLTTAAVASGHRKIELRPGHGYGISLRLRASEVFPAPGRYRIKIRYASPLPAPGNSSVRAGVVEGAHAESDLIEIEVLP